MNKEELRYNTEGVCPVCGSESLNYGSSGVDEGGYFYSWECEKCGACGKEWYDLVFSGHVLSKSGVCS